MHVLDGISTVIALTLNDDLYELNPILNRLLAAQYWSITSTVLGFMALTLFIIAGTILFVDIMNEKKWNNAHVTSFISMFYSFGIVIFIVYRFAFVVIPNFILAYS